MILLGSRLATDIRYALSYWTGLTRFIGDGRLELDTSRRGRRRTAGTRRRWTPLKGFPAAVAEIRDRHARGRTIEIWFEDEARVGQKNLITRRWAPRQLGRSGAGELVHVVKTGPGEEDHRLSVVEVEAGLHGAEGDLAVAIGPDGQHGGPTRSRKSRSQRSASTIRQRQQGPDRAHGSVNGPRPAMTVIPLEGTGRVVQ